MQISLVSRVLNRAHCFSLLSAKTVSMLVLLSLSSVVSGADERVLKSLKLSEHDSILVVSDSNQVLKSWQADKPLVPASLTKLATAHLAIEKWGLDHQFHTDFFIHESDLWVKGYGDPYLVSEELDLLLPKLLEKLQAEFTNSRLNKGPLKIRSINIDNTYFDIKTVPGRSKVADPYNAPVSAVSANFNSASLLKSHGKVSSAEKQTPLTPTAKRMAISIRNTNTQNIKERVNLQTAANAQLNFAELLVAKLTPLAKFELTGITIKVDQQLPRQAKLIYRHLNSHSLADVLRGTLEYSNNFIANQVFLALADDGSDTSVSFKQARDYAEPELANMFSWSRHSLEEGSGLSRSNRLSANQIDDLLRALLPNKTLFKKVKIAEPNTNVYAKTGTLNGVRSYAGYIDFLATDKRSAKSYRFVFNFNRQVPYRHRDAVLNMLLSDLSAQVDR